MIKLGSQGVEDEKESESRVNICASASVLKYLEGQAVDSVVLAYNTSSSKEKSPEQLLSELETLWATLETLVEEKKISRIGLSDLHEDIFIQFYNRAKVKPGIIQINLSSCCVVPPVLQEFAKSKKHDRAWQPGC
ncbi:glutamate--cysteine ligase regulatory subunit [Diaphorina citri]|uniref:GCS light chain n=1 Tax=Diaphorina citri TaxID=121845 RepID=A0A1S4EM78_DIACI|nr:glutamate--cysteine ligase regulatory subunit [Diaphorina citri]